MEAQAFLRSQTWSSNFSGAALQQCHLDKVSKHVRSVFIGNDRSIILNTFSPGHVDLAADEKIPYVGQMQDFGYIDLSP